MRQPFNRKNKPRCEKDRSGVFACAGHDEDYG